MLLLTFLFVLSKQKKSGGIPQTLQENKEVFVGRRSFKRNCATPPKKAGSGNNGDLLFSLHYSGLCTPWRIIQTTRNADTRNNCVPVYIVFVSVYVCFCACKISLKNIDLWNLRFCKYLSAHLWQKFVNSPFNNPVICRFDLIFKLSLWQN